MIERIKARIRKHHIALGCDWSLQWVGMEEALLEFILSEIAEAEKRGQSKVEHELRHVVAEFKETLHKIMIARTSLDASADRAEAAGHALINLLPGNSVPSTPDTDVTAFQGRVDGLSAALEAAAATGSTGGTPPPPPTP